MNVSSAHAFDESVESSARLSSDSGAKIQKNQNNQINNKKKGSYIHASTTKMKPMAKPIVFT